jgi:hypothetical protein
MLPALSTHSLQLRQLLKPEASLSPFSSHEQSNQMARALLDSYTPSESFHFLKSAEHILSSNSVYEADLVRCFQVKLVESILDQADGKEELWQILREIIQGNNSLRETGKGLLKEKLIGVIQKI